jgi:hypothetical protein
VRALPRERPTDIIRSVQAFAADFRAAQPGIGVSVDTMLAEAGAETPADHPSVVAVRAAHGKVTGRPSAITFVAWGGDAPRLANRGIPTVIYGPAFSRGARLSSARRLSAHRRYGDGRAGLCGGGHRVLRLIDDLVGATC